MMLGGATRVGLAEMFVESGKKLGHELKIISYDLTKEVPISMIGKVIKGLPWTDPAIINDITEVVKKNNVNIILPMVNGAVSVAAECKSAIPDIFVPVSKLEIVDKIYDKAAAAKIFKEARFPIPKTYSVLSATMPAIAKPRKGGYSKGIQIFYDMEDLMHLQNLQDYIVQEYIEYRKEYTVDSYIDQTGKILTIVPRERLEIMGGESVRTETVHNPELEDLSRKVIDKLELKGPVNLQFLHDLDNDRYLLMEVNARLAGAVTCSILAGAPITEYILRESLGLPLQICDDWKEGTLLARYFMDAVFHV